MGCPRLSKSSSRAGESLILLFWQTWLSTWPFASVWSVSGASWTQLRRSWAPLGLKLDALGANLEALGANLVALGANLDALGANLGPTWGQVGAMLATFPAQDVSITPPRRSKMPSRILWIAQDGPRGFKSAPEPSGPRFWMIFDRFLVHF